MNTTTHTKRMKKAIEAKAAYVEELKIINDKLNNFTQLAKTIHEKVFQNPLRLSHAKIYENEALLGELAHIAVGKVTVTNIDDEYIYFTTLTKTRRKLPLHVLSYSDWQWNKLCRNAFTQHKMDEAMEAALKEIDLNKRNIEQAKLNLKKLEKISKNLNKSIKKKKQFFQT